MATGKVSLKLVINKSNRTVLFAEACIDFVDFLLHILVLPVGQVIQLLTKTGMVGSLGNLYGSVEKLNDVYIKSSKKDIFLNPKAPAFLSGIPFLLPETSTLHSPPKTYYWCCSRSHINFWNYVAENRSALCPQCNNSMSQTLTFVKSALPKKKKTFVKAASARKTYYRCSSRKYFSCSSRLNNNCGKYVAEDRSAICPQCRNLMSHTFTTVISPAGEPAAAAASAAEWNGKGGFVLEEVTYMVMDDLAVKPMSTVSSITLLKNFNVEEIGLIEEKVVSLGIDEGIKLLMTSFHSKKVLTYVFLGVKRERS